MTAKAGRTTISWSCDRRWPGRALRLGALSSLVLALHAWLLETALPVAGADRTRLGARTIQARRIELAPHQDPIAVSAPATPSAAPPPRAWAATSASRPPQPTAAVEPQPHPSAGARLGTIEANAAALGAGADVPLYPTRIPASASLAYALRRGAATGHAQLDWRHESPHYELELQATLSGRPGFEQMSSGGFDDAGLAPLRYADRRRGRDLRAANFQRAAGKISFSAVTHEFALTPGAQDRLSWIAQLIAIVSAEPARWRSGERISMLVVGARGAADVWEIVVVGYEAVDLPTGSVPALRLVRAPSRPYDPQVEVWLSARHDWWPVQLRQIAQPSGETTEFRLLDGPKAS
jgi:hypothetical protein